MNPALVPYLLAHVLVHEIGHILQGIDRHSGSGVMKARWSSADYHEMARLHFGFTQEDIELIRIGLRGAQRRLCAAQYRD